MMDHAQFFLFRKLEIRIPGQAGISLDEQKTRELLCYLLLFRSRPHARDALAAMLWGSAPERQARGYLRRTLWLLQTGLAPLCLDPGGLLTVEADWVMLNFRAPLWLDVQVFEQAYETAAAAAAAAATAAVHSPSADGARLLEAAIRLYQGHLLESCYEDWCVLERERLLQCYLTMLEQMMDFCETTARYENGMRYGIEALRHDRARESTHARLIRLNALSGDRTGALRQFDRCEAALRCELGVTPSQATRALYEQIRAGRLPAPRADSQNPAVFAPSPRPVTELLDCIYQLEEVLLSFQQQVIQEMHVVDRMLPSTYRQPNNGPSL